MNVELSPKTWTRITSSALLATVVQPSGESHDWLPRKELIVLLLDGPVALRDAMDAGTMNVTPLRDGQGALRMMVGVCVDETLPLLDPSRWRWFASIKDDDLLGLTNRERSELAAAAEALDNEIDLDVPDHLDDGEA